MEQKRTYPVGTQDFSVIRERKMVYVDKTLYIYNLVYGGADTVFLSRPRRFGKTLFCDTLKHYFLGHRELFEGLAIYDLEKDWMPHPVLHFDMSACKKPTPDAVRTALNTLLREYENAYGREPDSDEPGDRLRYIIAQAHKLAGQRVVLIFDEYDAPVLNVIDDAQKMDEVREIFNSFYGPVKSMYEHLRFTFITGITKFSQMSIFSSINNIYYMTTDEEFEGICGITAAELERDLAPDVALLAAELHLTVEQTLEQLREQYDGYRFGPGLTEVYNPFSLVNAFKTGKIKSYWFDSATPSSLMKIMRLYPVTPSSFEPVMLDEYTFNQPFDDFDSPLPIMWQSGYLSIKDYDPATENYTLGIPNGEVRRGLYDTLLKHYINPSQYKNSSIQLAILQAMQADDIDAALTAVQSYMAALPYDLSNKTETDFETILKVLFDGLGVRVDTEVKTATGRVDVVMRSPRTTYVMELKLKGRATAATALKQINEKDYLIACWDDKRPIVKVGIAFDPAKRTIKNWKKEPANQLTVNS